MNNRKYKKMTPNRKEEKSRREAETDGYKET